MAFLGRLAMGALFGVGWSAPTDSPQVELDWSAPIQCPDREAVTTWLAAWGARVSAPGSTEAPPDLRASARVTTSVDVFEATIVLSWSEGATRSRTLTAPDCELLARAVALVVSVGLDPVQAAIALSGSDPPSTAIVGPHATEPRSPAPPTVAPAPAPEAANAEAPVPDAPVPATPPPAATSTRAPAWAGGLRLATGAGGLLLPGGGLGVSLLGWAQHGAVQLRIGAQYWLPRSESVGQGVTESFSSIAAVARVCWVPGVGRWAFPLCAGADAGAVLAGSEGATVDRRRAAPWAGGSVEVEAHLALTRWLGLWAQVGGTVSAYRARFHVDGLPASERTIGAARPYGFLGVSFRLPPYPSADSVMKSGRAGH